MISSLLLVIVLAFNIFTNILADLSSLNPIEINGKYFIDSQSKERFLVKGLAYQPGGASEVNHELDPLSDPRVCSRDIPLFQKLGVNTLRVYSINPDLDHNYCMSLLAMAGIYLILDVNSPLPNQHLNRYEPWKTYNLDYLEHIFKVVKQFSNYSNTLAFFIGNEVINDFRSSQVSPRFLRQSIGDVKQFMELHCKRTVPIGYAAADDLKYRVSLSDYLSCHNSSKPEQTVDFYGVNSYQWCGKQTLQSSGYDLLIDAYRDYKMPILLSEFGCNKVLPRKFNEIDGIFSKEMLQVFSGGLAYEYSQEANNYGLVEILENNNDVKLMSDFHELKNRYESINFTNMDTDDSVEQETLNTVCQDHYPNLNTNLEVNETLSQSLIEAGVDVLLGKYVQINANEILNANEAPNIYDVDGTLWKEQPTDLIIVKDIFSTTNKESTDKSNPKKKKNSSSRMLHLHLIMLKVLVSLLFLGVFCF